ncbi:MAG: hypothetical protein ABI361_11180 [Nitrososphaera sp.]
MKIITVCLMESIGHARVPIQIGREQWQEFVKEHNDDQRQFFIERLSREVTYTPLTVGAVNAVADLQDNLEKAKKTIALGVINPIGTELTELVSTLTQKELVLLSQAIWDYSVPSDELTKEVAKSQDVLIPLTHMMQRTRWTLDDLTQLSYDDLTLLIDSINKSDEVFQFLSEKYGMKRPDLLEQEFTDFIMSLIPDYDKAIKEYESKQRRRRI